MGRCYVGINGVSSAINDIYIKMCQIEYNDIGIYLGEGRTQSLYNCDIENNKSYGLRKTNEGDIQVINCYFEDKLYISYGQTYVSNILILGCSFFQSPSNLDEAYTPITYHGNLDYTKISVINCNFKNLSNDDTTYNTPAIAQLNNYGTVNPILINNTCYNMLEFDVNYFKGVYINNGTIDSYLKGSWATNYFNGSDGKNLDITLNSPIKYRVNLFDSGNATITLPTVPKDKRMIPIEYEFIVAGNNSTGLNGIITFTPISSDSCNIYGEDKTISKNDINKLIKAIYIGNFNSKDNWEIIK